MKVYRATGMLLAHDEDLDKEVSLRKGGKINLNASGEVAKRLLKRGAIVPHGGETTQEVVKAVGRGKALARDEDSSHSQSAGSIGTLGE